MALAKRLHLGVLEIRLGSNRGGMAGAALSCDNGCRSARESGAMFKPAPYRVFILGYPAGRVCEGCGRDMARIWAQNMTQEEVRDVA